MALTNESVAGGVTGNKAVATPKYILDGYQVEIAVPEAFTGGTASTRGAFGTRPTGTIFTVQGEVKVIVYGVCTTTLAGATSTISLGLAGNTALILPLPAADAATVAAGEVWLDTSVAEVGGFVATSLPAATYITNSQNIIETVGVANITAGNIYYVCLWIPISPNGMVKAVSPGRVN